MTANEHEQYVRQRWEQVKLITGESLPAKHKTYSVSLGNDDNAWHCTDWDLNQITAWSAAYTFTLQREEEIKLKQEEIALMTSKLLLEDKDIVIADRIIAALKLQLADLMRGMKESADVKGEA